MHHMIPASICQLHIYAADGAIMRPSSLWCGMVLLLRRVCCQASFGGHQQLRKGMQLLKAIGQTLNVDIVVRVVQEVRIEGLLLLLLLLLLEGSLLIARSLSIMMYKLIITICR
jgi:hypothetical protein